MVDKPATSAPAQPAQGPYRVDTKWVLAADGTHIAAPTLRTDDATARLLAASWDLLASCQEFLPILEQQLHSINPGGAAEGSRAFQAASERIARMRAAIAKAEAVG